MYINKKVILEEIKYYLYPKIDFTEEELKNLKILLIIGQTGHGKTTFVNALEYACSKNPEYYITDTNREQLYVYCEGISNPDREHLENKEFDKILNDISVQLCTRVTIKHR